MLELVRKVKHIEHLLKCLQYEESAIKRQEQHINTQHTGNKEHCSLTEATVKRCALLFYTT